MSDHLLISVFVFLFIEILLYNESVEKLQLKSTRVNSLANNVHVSYISNKYQSSPVLHIYTIE